MVSSTEADDDDGTQTNSMIATPASERLFVSKINWRTQIILIKNTRILELDMAKRLASCLFSFVFFRLYEHSQGVCARDEPWPAAFDPFVISVDKQTEIKRIKEIVCGMRRMRQALVTLCVTAGAYFACQNTRWLRRQKTLSGIEMMILFKVRKVKFFFFLLVCSALILIPQWPPLFTTAHSHSCVALLSWEYNTIQLLLRICTVYWVYQRRLRLFARSRSIVRCCLFCHCHRSWIS